MTLAVVIVRSKPLEVRMAVAVPSYEDAYESANA